MISCQEAGEKIYDSWDCPRVEAVEEYQGEVSLRPGDEANVLRKKDEGGYKVDDDPVGQQCTILAVLT